MPSTVTTRSSRNTISLEKSPITQTLVVVRVKHEQIQLPSSNRDEQEWAASWGASNVTHVDRQFGQNWLEGGGNMGIVRARGRVRVMLRLREEERAGGPVRSNHLVHLTSGPQGHFYLSKY
jgi:hypothetical protein